MTTVNVGIKYILDDREFRQKVRSSNTEAKQLTKTQEKHKRTIRDVQVQEKRGVSTKKRELDLTKKQTREIERQDRALKKSNRTRKVAGGRTVSGFGQSALRGAMPFIGAAAIGAGIGSMVTKAADFDLNVRKILTMDVTLDKDDVEKKIKKLSEKYPLEIGSIAEGVYQALSTGTKYKDVDRAIGEASRLSIVAGNQDVAGSISFLNKARIQFGEEDLALIAASGFKGFQSGAFTVGELASNLPKVGNIASLSGLNVPTTIAMSAVISKNAESLDQGITQMKALILAITAPTPEAKKKAAALGISFGDEARGENFIPTLEKIFEVTGGSLEQIRKIIPEREAIQAVPGLLETRELLTTFDDTDALLKEFGTAVEIMTGSFQAKKTEFSNAMTRLSAALLLDTGLLEGLGDVISNAASDISTTLKFSQGEDTTDDVGKMLDRETIWDKLFSKFGMSDIYKNTDADGNYIDPNFVGPKELKTTDEEVKAAVETQTTLIVEAINAIDIKPTQQSSFVGPIKPSDIDLVPQ